MVHVYDAVGARRSEASTYFIPFVLLQVTLLFQFIQLFAITVRFGRWVIPRYNMHPRCIRMTCNCIDVSRPSLAPCVIGDERLFDEEMTTMCTPASRFREVYSSCLGPWNGCFEYTQQRIPICENKCVAPGLASMSASYLSFMFSVEDSHF